MIHTMQQNRSSLPQLCRAPTPDSDVEPVDGILRPFNMARLVLTGLEKPSLVKKSMKGYKENPEKRRVVRSQGAKLRCFIHTWGGWLISSQVSQLGHLY